MCGAKVSRCPVTSSTLISILRNRSLLAPWCRRAARSRSAPNHAARATQGRAIVMQGPKKPGSCRFRGEGDHHGTYEVRRHPFEIMRPLKDGAVLIQERLTHAAEGAQEVSQARPDAFDRVGMDFADAITVIISRPFALSWRMADRLMEATGL